jgi:hypothetical protein
MGTPAVSNGRRGLSDEELRRRYPVLDILAGPPGTGQEAWETVFEARPDIMVRILQDVIKQAYAKPGRIGQRPMPHEEEVDLDELTGGAANELPLVEVLPKLLAPAGERAFCIKLTSMSRSTFKRILAGTYKPNMAELREIARAAGKSPTFFVEYRKLAAVTALVNLIEDRPGIATRLYHDYLLGQAS